MNAHEKERARKGGSIRSRGTRSKPRVGGDEDEQGRSSVGFSPVVSVLPICRRILRLCRTSGSWTPGHELRLHETSMCSVGR